VAIANRGFVATGHAHGSVSIFDPEVPVLDVLV
jgi:hypothetical protein